MNPLRDYYCDDHDPAYSPAPVIECEACMSHVLHRLSQLEPMFEELEKKHAKLKTRFKLTHDLLDYYSREALDD